MKKIFNDIMNDFSTRTAMLVIVFFGTIILCVHTCTNHDCKEEVENIEYEKDI